MCQTAAEAGRAAGENDRDLQLDEADHAHNPYQGKQADEWEQAYQVALRTKPPLKRAA